MHVRKRHKVAIAAAAAAFTGGTLVVVLGIPFAAGGAPLPERGGAPAASGERASEPPREPVPAELDLLHTARELLLRDCMRAKGFVYQPVPRQPVPEAREFPLVLDDVDWARRHGYGSDLAAVAERNQRDDVNQHYFESLPADRRVQALLAANGPRTEGLTARTPDGMEMGRSPEGCQSDADRTLYGDLAGWFQARTTLTSLTSLVSERAGAAPEFSEATRPWAVCMRTAGHDFADPAAVRAALPVPRTEEIRLAVAEATCAQSSGLAETASGLSRKFETELRERYRADVNTAFRLQLGALSRARSVIASD
ncbi:hypothetical protein ABZY44_37420 [Streptomyces sp. NPDC006544]|uniref:hypothetical protein n=1 Tax=Streptomyces sp. NPDC006544 TaxID=3154583 RepID=UPI0033BF7E07